MVVEYPDPLVHNGPNLSSYLENCTSQLEKKAFSLADILASLEEGPKVDPGLSDLKPELFLTCLLEGLRGDKHRRKH